MIVTAYWKNGGFKDFDPAFHVKEENGEWRVWFFDGDERKRETFSDEQVDRVTVRSK